MKKQTSSKNLHFDHNETGVRVKIRLHEYKALSHEAREQFKASHTLNIIDTNAAWYWRKVFILANQMAKHNPEASRSLLFKLAKDIIDREGARAQVLVFTTVKGRLTTRMVFSNWSEYNEIKGTGRPLAPGVKLFVDIAKRESNKPSTISARKDNIISLAA